MHFRPFAILRIFTVSLAAWSACTDKPSTRPADAAVDASLEAAAPDARLPDGWIPPPFAPATMTLRQLSCLSHSLSTGAGSSGDASRQVDLALIKSAGIQTLRSHFMWHRAEKTKGAFDFSGYDLRVKAAAAAGVEHVAVLAYGNPWATTATTTDPYYPPDDPADFAAFVKQIVARYKGQISTYEIWNEPNAGYRFWKSNPLGDPAAYGALLKAASAAAKQADPAAEVVFGGLFFHEQIIPGHLKFLDAAYRAHPSLGHWFDGVALHPYAYYPPGVPPELDMGLEAPVYRMLSSVRDLLVKHGDGAAPIYTTEVGWPLWKKVTAQQQAAYLVRSFFLLAAAGSRLYCWYTLRDRAAASAPTEGTFGLFTADDPPKPKISWAALKTLLNSLGSYRLDRDLRSALALNPDAFAYRLIDSASGRRATVLWTTASVGKVTLPLAAATTKITRVSMTGIKGSLTPTAGAVTVDLKAAPVYILEE